MTDSSKLILLAALVALSLILAATAWRLWRKMQKQGSVKADESEEIASEKRERLIKSLGLLAQTTLREELNISEAALRVKTLLDHLIPEEHARTQYQAIYDLHDATEHFAKLKARDALPAQERLRQDTEREQIEEQYREPVLASMRSILEHGFR